MAEVHGEGLAPHAEVADVEDREVTGQREDERLLLIAPQWHLLAVLVRDADTLRRWLGPATHPELGVCRQIKNLQS